MKTVKLTESDITRLVKRVLSEQEVEQSNYMFFSNLKQKEVYDLELEIPYTENFKFIYIGVEDENGDVIYRHDLTTYQEKLNVKIESKLSQYQDETFQRNVAPLISYMNEPVLKDGDWEEFIRVTNGLDARRKQKFASTFPEFYNIIKNDWPQE